MVNPSWADAGPEQAPVWGKRQGEATSGTELLGKALTEAGARLAGLEIQRVGILGDIANLLRASRAWRDLYTRADEPDTIRQEATLPLSSKDREDTAEHFTGLTRAVLHQLLAGTHPTAGGLHDAGDLETKGYPHDCSTLTTRALATWRLMNLGDDEVERELHARRPDLAGLYSAYSYLHGCLHTDREREWEVQHGPGAWITDPEYWTGEPEPGTEHYWRAVEAERLRLEYVRRVRELAADPMPVPTPLPKEHRPPFCINYPVGCQPPCAAEEPATATVPEQHQEETEGQTS